MTPGQVSSRIAARFGPGAVSDVTNRTVTADVPAGRWAAALTFARDELGCDRFDWLSTVEEPPDGRAVIVHVYSMTGGHHLLLRTRVAAGASHVPTATHVYARAAAYECETAERSGIRFEGHPGTSPVALGDDLDPGAPRTSRSARASTPGELPNPPGTAPADPRRRRRHSR